MNESPSDAAASPDREALHPVLSKASAELLSLAKRWADNTVHTYRHAVEAEAIVLSAIRAATHQPGLQVALPEERAALAAFRAFDRRNAAGARFSAEDLKLPLPALPEAFAESTEIGYALHRAPEVLAFGAQCYRLGLATTAAASELEPMLLGDLSRELGVDVPDLARTAQEQGLGNFSVNMAVPRKLAAAMRAGFAGKAPGAVPRMKAPLTDARIRELEHELACTVGGSMRTMARAVEREHGIGASPAASATLTCPHCDGPATAGWSPEDVKRGHRWEAGTKVYHCHSAAD